MTKLEELIKELCPNGVEYKFVGDVCDTITDYVAAGSFAEIAKKVKYINTPEYALLVRTTDLKSNFAKGDFIYIDKEAYDFLWRVHLDAETIILPNIGNCGEVYYITKDRLPYPHCALAPNAIMVRSSTCLNLYLKYVFESEYFQKQLMKIVSPTGQTKFNKTDLKRLLIPLPPLAVQREIVRILDKFTLYSQELAAELAARRVQYEYYRDQLVSFNNKTEQIKWVLLQEILEIKNGSDYKRFGEGQYPVYGSGGVMTYIDNFIYDKPSVLIPRKGSLNNLFYVETPFWTVDTIFYTIIDTTKVVPKFVFYYLQNQHLEKLNKAGGVPSLTQSVLNLIKFPIPPLDIQERIVKVLDNFDAICSDLGIGLPAEIEKRQQQYEFYRDKLLTFGTGSATIFTDRQTDRQTDRAD